METKEKLFCQLDGKYYTKMGIVRIIKKFGHPIQEYYDTHYRKPNEGICGACGSRTKFTKFSYQKFCNVKCAAQVNNNLKKMRDNRSEEELKLLNKRMVDTRKARYSNESMQAKRIATVEQKYGMSYREFKSKLWIKRFNEMDADQLSAYYDKATKSRNCYKYKYYELNGNIVRVQGYEPLVLDVLRKLFDEDKILVDDGIKIPYIDQYGKKRRYYPDIVIGDYLFEVKSKYTFGLHLSNTLLKMSAAQEHGYIPFIVLWDIKNSEMCEKDLIETISSQALLSHEGRFNDYPFIGVGNKSMISEVLGTPSGS